jgi:membrane protease YdiL (CAAX protease family)
MKANLYRVLAIILPVVMLVVFSTPLHLAMAKLHDPLLKSGAAILGTTAAAFIMFYVMTLLRKKTGAPAIRSGGWKGALLGLLAGFGVSLASGMLFSMTHGVSIDFHQVSHVSLRFAVSIPSSVLEETAFRGGVVHFVATYFGGAWGLMAGSVPFGLLHLLNLFFGIPVDFSQMMGLFAAGLLLSLVYLRLGLIAAVEVHWIWNSLNGLWVGALALPSGTGQMIFEGAWTTTAVLLGVCLFFYFLPVSSEKSG